MISPGQTIGILGGGQLGRMLALAAAKLGYKTHIYSDKEDAPAFDVTRYHTVADYQDKAALEAFAGSVDVITYEFENIPVQTVEFLSALAPIRPGAKALGVTQDRLNEKQFLESVGVKCAPYMAFDSIEGLQKAISSLGRPLVAKHRRESYDGKGQMVIKTPKDARTAEEAYEGIQSIVEKLIPFDREVSVIVARDTAGNVAAYPVCENHHKNHILAETRVPATLSDTLEAKAKVIATKIANGLDYVGVVTVEMFVIEKDNQILVNEIAPRVHNSGHWTIEGAVTSQFEQHIRAICDLPLGATDALGPVVMTNLLGTSVSDIKGQLEDGYNHYHHYGKNPLREGRKTGHVTRLQKFTE